MIQVPKYVIIVRRDECHLHGLKVAQLRHGLSMGFRIQWLQKKVFWV